MLQIYPAHMLALECQPVQEADFGDKLDALVAEMRAILEQTGGIGIAANQVGVPLRVFLMNIRDPGDTAEPAETGPGFMVFVNPVVQPVGTGRVRCQEGCLSFPGVYEWIERPSAVAMRYQTQTGEVKEAHLEDTWAVCAQHEQDHLNGKTFLERVSPLKRKFMLKDLAQTLAKFSKTQ